MKYETLNVHFRTLAKFNYGPISLEAVAALLNILQTWDILSNLREKNILCG